MRNIRPNYRIFLAWAAVTVCVFIWRATDSPGLLSTPVLAAFSVLWASAIVLIFLALRNLVQLTSTTKVTADVGLRDESKSSVRKSFKRTLRIVASAYVIGWLFTSAANFYVGYRSDEYGGNRKIFAVNKADETALLLLFWLPAAALEIGIHMGWVCKSAEIGRC